jgi:peptidoglycan hydrolase-like protein with peptidoglycan-binding domain
VRAVPVESADGMLAGIVDRIFEDPARSGGLMVVAMTATAIVCNALLLQHAQRPAPLFAPRSAQNAAPAPVPLPNPAPAYRTDDPVDASVAHAQAAAPVAIAAPPLPRPSPAKAMPAAPAKPAAIVAQPQAAVPVPAKQTVQPAVPQQPSVALVTEIQRGLARLGLYTGPIDGKSGGQTSAAIAKYQEAAGVAATGQATPEFLQALQHPSMTMAAKPVSDPIASELDQATQQRAATIAAQQAADAKAAAADNAAAARKAAADSSAAAQTKNAATYRTVQTALNRIGYGPVPVDGAANKATLDAIRGFELDNGLPVSGEPSEALIQRLTAIGAIKPN